MQAWRIAKERYALERNGAGGLTEGGRWHRRGMPVLYAGLSIEICVLEKLVHTGPLLPADLVLVELTLPDEPSLYETAAAPDLPPGWDATPPRAASIDVGMAFLRAGSALGLRVPSAIVPEARNIVLNPAHPRFADASLAISRPFAFDGRLRNR